MEYKIADFSSVVAWDGMKSLYIVPKRAVKAKLKEGLPLLKAMAEQLDEYGATLVIINQPNGKKYWAQVGNSKHYTLNQLNIIADHIEDDMRDKTKWKTEEEILKELG